MRDCYSDTKLLCQTIAPYVQDAGWKDEACASAAACVAWKAYADRVVDPEREDV